MSTKTANHKSFSRSEIAAMIPKKLKAPGDSFSVDTVKERVMVLQTASALFQSGFVKFRVASRKNEDGGFTISAVNP